MSFRVVAKALRDSNEKLARRLILIVLAEAAHDDGVVWLDQSSIAYKARLSRTHVAEMLREMDAVGVLETRKAQRGRRRIAVYRLLLPGLDEVVYDRLPFDLDRPFTVSEVPTPSPGDDVGSTGSTVSDLPEESRPLVHEPSLEPPIQTARRDLVVVPAKVDRLPVTPKEGELAVSVLSDWNRQTGQTLTSRDWIAKIVMRIREHPELSADEHSHIVATALANPWWTGPASPSVVYGSGAQFERSILAVTAPSNGRPPPRRFGTGMTTREILDAYEGQS